LGIVRIHKAAAVVPSAANVIVGIGPIRSAANPPSKCATRRTYSQARRLVSMWAPRLQHLLAR